MGIGSEGVVALKANRRFVGIELKKEYFEQSCRHLSEAYANSNDLFLGASA
jgi:DNA modification methylase